MKLKKVSPWSVFVICAFLYTASLNVALVYFSGIDRPEKLTSNADSK